MDIYDASTNTWSTTDLPRPAYLGSAAAIGKKVFFWFHNDPYNVTIYDLAANSWSSHSISVPRPGARVMSVGNKILIAGDGRTNNGAAASVEIYDALSNNWSVAKFNHPVYPDWFAVSGNKLLLYSSSFNGYILDIYDASTNTWSAVQFKFCFFNYPVLADGKLFFGGGERPTNGLGNENTHRVWKFEF